MTFRSIVCALVLGCTSLCMGEIIGSPLTIEATNAMGTGVWEGNIDDGQFDDEGNYFFSVSEPISITNMNGDEIAKLDSASLTVIEDPVVSLNFVVSSANMATSFVIDSPILAFAPQDLEGRASAAITVTDIGGDGASLSGNTVPNRSYQARYDATTFTNLVEDTATGTAFSSATSNGEFPAGGAFTPVGVISQMDASFAFEIGALDSASGTSVWVTRPVPEPSTLALVLCPFICLIWAIRRR